VKHIKQTASTCGQCSLAMILDHVYPGHEFCEDSVCTNIGHRKGTRIEDLYEVLDMYDVPHTGKGIPITSSTILPHFCILAMRYPGMKGGNWHWVVFYRGYVYDPNADEPIKGGEYQDTIKPSLTTYHQILVP